MASLEETLKRGMLLRICLYGAPKTKKTWWALRAAEAGFNTFLFDCDDGAHIGVQLPEEARKRVQVLNATDGLGSPISSIYAAHLFKGVPFLWDATTKKQIRGEHEFVKEHEHYKFDITKLTSNDVFILDSWTALVYSIAWKYSQENMIDLTNFNKTEWDGYAFCGRMATWILKQLTNLPCHVIMIGHETTYEKYSGNKNNRKLEWQRTQMQSTSGPHAMTIGMNFSDTLHFKFQGVDSVIDVVPVSDADGGSRLVPPRLYKWDELQFIDVCRMGHIPLPDNAPPSEGIVNYPAGSEDVDLNVLPGRMATNLITQNRTITPQPQPQQPKPNTLNALLAGGKK